MEDRSESVLKHSGKYDMYIKSLKGHQEALHSKVKYIQKTAECKKNLLHRYFSSKNFLALVNFAIVQPTIAEL